MSVSTAETFIRYAKEQRTQTDINNSLIRALAEVLREMKDLENEVNRLRRVVNRRF